ncbi:hypothetical protein [Haloferax volcanii]|uniref:Uncharacterized protein n=1 Tax=Haloferax lucentense (strain DSM 14919 / JCM 9276 / NCIMB 13854 / Aa 2.2) TaxID=1230452 RepID=M0GV18_HALL2|nr:MULTISPECIES: hypothetical protein [Haloferax]ELZ76071.1 hypothetical protein C456_04565 [Haloferax lucentense DSM 14919]
MSKSDDPRSKTVRERIIEDAQVRCHQKRSEVQDARLRMSMVPRSLRGDFQNRVLEYYRALRPLRSEGIIKEWWSSVVLSPTWTAKREYVFEIDGQTLEVSQDEAMAFYEKQGVPPVEVRDIPFQGLERLDELEDATETVVETRSTMRGVREEQTTQQVVLDVRQLMDIAGVLDDAATKLGFAPAFDEETPNDDGGLDDLRELLRARGQDDAAQRVPGGDN